MGYPTHNNLALSLHIEQGENAASIIVRDQKGRIMGEVAVELSESQTQAVCHVWDRKRIKNKWEPQYSMEWEEVYSAVLSVC